MLKKTIAVLMSIFTTLSFASCAFLPSGNDSNSGNVPNPEGNGAVWQGSENNKKQIKTTDAYLDEKQEWNIVVPDDATDEEVYASSELYELLTESTGLSFYLEEESNVTVNDNGYYWFVGDTQAAKDAGVVAEYSKLGDSGVVVKTVDNQMFLLGATGKGTVYAVYEYLNQAFEYEFFAEDEYYIGDGIDAKWLEIDLVYRPAISNPCFMYGELNSNAELYYKYRIQNYYETWMAKEGDVYYAHTYFKILPKEKWQKSHPDFYSPDGNNLCLTRDPDIVDAFVESCKEIIVTDDVHRYMMFGQEDNFEFCNCEDCQDRMEELGGFSSAIMMEFTNEVVRELNIWLEETQPDRNITFVTFAYNHTKHPPVTYDEETKEYLPISDSVIAEPNLSVQYVINNCDYYKSYEKQKSIVRALEGWDVLTDTITIWEYSTNFTEYMDTFHNWHSVADNIRLLASHGVDYIVEQAAYNTCTSNFSELRMYVWSKLMWNPNLNVQDLIDEFMVYYYRDAADEMQNLFNSVYGYIDELVSQYGLTVRSGGVEIMKKQYWSQLKLQSFRNMIDETLESIAYLEDLFADEYKTIVKRVMKQSVWMDYYRIKYYPNMVTPEEKTEWKKLALSYGIVLAGEGQWI